MQGKELVALAGQACLFLFEFLLFLLWFYWLVTGEVCKSSCKSCSPWSLP